MMRRSEPRRKFMAHANHTFFPIAPHKFKELSSWRCQAMGIRAREAKMSGRPTRVRERFNPAARHVTKGTEGYAWKWLYWQQAHLPNLRPNGEMPPIRVGKAAWPPAWDEEFAHEALMLTPEDLRESVLQHFTEVVFEETQRDGYELRRLDFEGKPLTEFPEKAVIENFVLEEETIRERVVKQIVENVFRFPVTSTEREELRSLEVITDFITDRMETCRVPLETEVSEHVKDILQEHPDQPSLGFQHAVPSSRWGDNKVLDHWEKLFRHDWQFGNAVYEPRNREKTRGNLTWMKMEVEDREKEAFQQYVASGQAKEDHMARIAAAAEAKVTY